MARLAFIFPGQGSQYVGMGKEAYEAFDSARDVFVEADSILGFPLSQLCFRGPEEELRFTQNTQPAILTVSIAIARVLEERGVRPDYVAGHSLGEYSALVCAGAIAFSDAVILARKRGRYMQEAVGPGQGAMAAVLGLNLTKVQEACAEASSIGFVAPANLNASDQIVIAGLADAVRKACDNAKEKGATRVISLAVSAPFHCELMAPARDRLTPELEAMDFRDLRIPLVNNADAREIREGSRARDSLIRQICAPVRWEESIQHMVQAGIESFVEVGPGKVLSGLVRRIVPRAQTGSADGIRGIEALASAFSDAKM